MCRLAANRQRELGVPVEKPPDRRDVVVQRVARFAHFARVVKKERRVEALALRRQPLWPGVAE